MPSAQAGPSIASPCIAHAPCSSTIGFFSARACLISIWQYGRCKTSVERKSTKAAACSMPFSMPSLVKSSARLSYHAFDERGNNNEGESTSWVRVRMNECEWPRARILRGLRIYLESHPFEFEVDGVCLVVTVGGLKSETASRNGTVIQPDSPDRRPWLASG